MNKILEKVFRKTTIESLRNVDVQNSLKNFASNVKQNSRKSTGQVGASVSINTLTVVLSKIVAIMSISTTAKVLTTVMHKYH